MSAKSLEKENEKLQNLIVEISKERDDAVFTAKLKSHEAESDANKTINDLVSQVNYWEEKYNALIKTKYLYEAVLEKCADVLYQVKNVEE